MALNANNSKNSTGPKIDPVEAGSYPARLVVVADLGLQTQRDFQGEKKPPAYEILTVYELADEFMKDEEGKDDTTKPRWQSESFPLYSLQSEKAKSTKRYLALDPQGLVNGDWTKLIGTPVMVTLVVTPSKKGKLYNNIGGTSPMRSKDALRVPELVNKPVILDLDNPSVEAYKALPQWVQKRITENLEYKGSKLASLLGGSDKAPPPIEDETLESDLDDEIPF